MALGFFVDNLGLPESHGTTWYEFSATGLALTVTVTRDKGNLQLPIHFCIVFCILLVGKDFFRYRLSWDATTIFANAKNIATNK